MNNKKGYLLIFVLALVLGLILRGCWQKQLTGYAPKISAVLPSSDTVRVAIKDNTLEVQTPTGIETKYVPEEGQAVVDVKKTGKPVITVTNKGFTHRFGADVFLADKFRIGGDCEFIYWNRFGVITGLGFSSNPLVVGFAGISYQLDQVKLDNTSIWAGYTTNKNIAIGVRVAF